MKLQQPQRYIKVQKDYKDAEGNTHARWTEELVTAPVKALSVEGQEFKASADGTFEVPDALAERLLREGWTRLAPTKPADPPADDPSKKDGGKVDGGKTDKPGK